MLCFIGSLDQDGGTIFLIYEHSRGGAFKVDGILPFCYVNVEDVCSF